MLRAHPNSWLSWNYTVTDQSVEVAVIDLAWVREAGHFTVSGQRYEVRRESMWGAFVLSSSGDEIARADKPSALLRSFSINVDGSSYILKAASPFQRAFVLPNDRERLGTIRPQGVFSRKAIVDIHSDISRPVQIFMLWLVVVLWRRQANSN